MIDYRVSSASEREQIIFHLFIFLIKAYNQQQVCESHGRNHSFHHYHHPQMTEYCLKRFQTKQNRITQSQ